MITDDELSQTDVTDVLVEKHIYDDQLFAREMIGNAWFELARRSRWIGPSCAFEIDGDWIYRKSNWNDSAAYTFCILLSVSAYFDWWQAAFGQDYSDQGELFELMTIDSLKAQFQDWEVFQTGWTRSNTAGLRKVVDQVVNRLGEEPGNLALWDEPQAKERGLDLLWYRPFSDNRVGIPVYLVQCASGRNWKSKLHTPDLNIWCSVINFTTRPGRAFASPFVFLDRQFQQNCTIIQGVLLDRCRLLSAFLHDLSWLSSATSTRMNDWSRIRIAELGNRSR